jgi:hypothetical protein
LMAERSSYMTREPKRHSRTVFRSHPPLTYLAFLWSLLYMASSHFGAL